MVELVFLLVLVGAAVALVVTVTSSRRTTREREAAELAAAKRVAEEDVTRLGEDVAALDVDVAGRVLDDATRQDYRRALDAYDASKAALDAVARPEDVRGVTQALEDGRYAVACVQARLRGEPVPTRRPPCFFNPQHGPSTDDVEWAPPGGAPRSVPACAADAERVRAGAEPDTRKVLVGSQRRPYWEGGPAYAPWAQGYFSPYAGSGLLPGVLLGAVLAGGFGGWGGGGYEQGYGDGFDAAGEGGDAGGADAGGYEGGGYDGGGGFGDFGGGGFGDFGGGDF